MMEIAIGIIRVATDQCTIIVQLAILGKRRICFHRGRGMVRCKVNDNLDAFGMSRRNQVLKIRHRAEVWIGLFEVPSPVAMVGCVGYTAIVDRGKIFSTGWEIHNAVTPRSLK